MDGRIAMPTKLTCVVASGKTEDNKTISQDVPIPHQDGVKPPQILFAAIETIKKIGGLLIDTPDGGVDFYIATKFVGPIHFEIKKITLAGADDLNALKNSPQLMQ